MGTEPSDSGRGSERPMPVELASLSPDELNALDRALAAAGDADERSRLIQQFRLESPRKAAQLVKLMEWREPPSDFLMEPLLPHGFLTPQERTLRTGQLVANRYRIEKLLGSGGMGDVYRAFDTALDRPVALKTLRSEIVSDKAMLARFRREFLLTRRIGNPNVCRVLELGTPEDGPAFLTMELLDGPSLSAHLKKCGRLSPDAAYPIVRQLLMGVGAAHREGIVHRDLKPANVHLCTDSPGELRVVVTDFGLARLAAPTEGTSTSLTGTGNVIGTLAYMAPELLSGKDASFSSDVYAIGVIMYEMMTGRRPFESESQLTPSLRCLTEDPPDPRLIVPDLEPHWVDAIQGCLERDPARRYSDTEVVLRVLGKEKFEPPKPAKKPLGRRNLLLGVAAVVVCAGALLKSLPTTLTGYRQAQALLMRYDKPGHAAEAASLFVQTIADDPREPLAHAGLARAYLQQFLDSRDAKLLEQASNECARALELNANLAAVHIAAGRIQRAAGNTEAALRELRRAFEFDSRSADARAALGDVYNDQGRTNEAEESYRAAVDLDPNDWRWRNDLGSFYRGVGKISRAIEQFQRSVDLTPDNSIACFEFGRALFLQGNYDEAFKYTGRALDSGLPLRLLEESPDLAKLREDPRYKVLAGKRR